MSASSITLTPRSNAVAATASETPPAISANASAPSTEIQPNLVVEEYAITPGEWPSPDRLEFAQSIPAQVRSRRTAFRNPPPDKLVESTNTVLARFGYRLEHDPLRSSYSYILFKDNVRVLDDLGISSSRPISLNSAGDDFALYLYSAKNGDRVLRRDSIERWQPTDLTYTAPVLAGDALTVACYEDAPLPFVSGQVVVKQGAKKVFSTPAEWLAENPIKGLWSWQGHWVLEVAGKVFIDGKSLSTEKVYDEFFEWRVLHGQPFYFFGKGEVIGVSYAGKTLPYEYSEVVHYRCCEPAMFNPGYTENMIWFYARRGETWNYVEMGVYE
jgi:hypothetical protein